MTPAERIVAELRLLPVAEVHARVEAALAKQRERAEGSPDHAALLAAHERMLLQHQPTGSGPPSCAGCEEPWPCGVVAGVIASG